MVQEYEYTVKRDPKYAPCGFLICRRKPGEAFDTRDDPNTILVQSDWDFPGLARNFGWAGCPHGSDGTVPCKECNKVAGDFISEAYDYLEEHQGELFDGSDYFPQGEPQ